jgi:anti-sigma factor RsiW
MVENLRASRHALRAHLPRYAASAQLTARIQNSLSKPDSAPLAPNPRPAPVVVPFPVRRPRSPFLRWGGAASALAAALCLGFFIGVGQTRSDQIEREAVSAHVRSLMAGHLMDVASTDQHTVKPWFAGKLDFSPPVTDLAANEFPLIGGRLDEIDQHPAAALVYKRRQHTINLFIWPGATSESSTHAYQSDGYHVVSWTQAGFHFLAISDVAKPDLETFVTLYRSHL